LNGYGFSSDPGPKDDPSYVPPGWDDWQALISLRMYDWQLSDNGVVTNYGAAPSDYQTDVLRQRALDFVADGEAIDDAQPFFLLVTPFAPHLEPGGLAPGCANSKRYQETIRPAPRHAGTLPPGIVLLHGPAFNEADMSDKPPALQQLLPYSPLDTQCAESFWRARQEAMLAVDELVGALVADLATKDELANTVLIFTSDNGYLFGEHRLHTKVVGYEESVLAALAIRAPGYAGGQVTSRLVSNVDLAPTIGELAGVTMGVPADGRSLVPLLEDPETTPWRDRVFGEYLGTLLPGGMTYRMVRTGPGDTIAPSDALIVWSDGPVEYYDLDSDPYQLQSRHADPDTAPQRAYLGTLVEAFKTCVGAECRALE
jgi:arylsulfatase A-like enzyme